MWAFDHQHVFEVLQCALPRFGEDVVKGVSMLHTAMFNPCVSAKLEQMSAAEDLILTITTSGTGKLSSSHDYPVRGRGGMGVKAMDSAMRGGPLVASFKVELSDQIMLATSTGQSFRVPVDQISFRSRSAGGVKVLNTGGAEEVVSVARVAEQAEE